MRLDLFLKASRLCQRRAVAQRLCDAGLVLVNDKPAKSAHPVKPGDGVTIRHRNQVTKVQVISLPSARQTSRAEADALYRVLGEESLPALSVGHKAEEGSTAEHSPERSNLHSRPRS